MRFFVVVLKKNKSYRFITIKYNLFHVKVCEKMGKIIQWEILPCIYVAPSICKRDESIRSGTIIIKNYNYLNPN